MKETNNKKLIKQAKDLIDLGLKNYLIRHNRKGIIDMIRTDRMLLLMIIRCIEVNNRINEAKLLKFLEFNTFIDSGVYFKIINIDSDKDLNIIDVSRLYAGLEVINTVTIDKGDIYLNNNLAIRLVNDPDNEVWLYEDELLELY